jgi:hypothetical protein
MLHAFLLGQTLVSINAACKFFLCINFTLHREDSLSIKLNLQRLVKNPPVDLGYKYIVG